MVKALVLGRFFLLTRILVQEKHAAIAAATQERVQERVDDRMKTAMAEGRAQSGDKKVFLFFRMIYTLFSRLVHASIVVALAHAR